MSCVTMTKPSSGDVCAEDTQTVIAALPPQHVIYFQTSVDSQNRTLDASKGNNYTITFPLPLPAQSFWSLTLYNATSLNLINNTINRYTIGDRAYLYVVFVCMQSVLTSWTEVTKDLVTSALAT